MKMTEVLIAGAGPCGLTLACDLARRGHRVRIIDKNPQPTHQSRALGVQAGTLEVYKKIFGDKFVKKLTKRGLHAQSANIHLDSNLPVNLDLSRIPSEFNYVLILEQSETEKFLIGKLKEFGVTIEREFELSKFNDHGDHVISHVINPSGQIEAIESQFLIGCDGAHSVVRHGLNLEFTGEAYQQLFQLGDVQVSWKWEYQQIRMFVNPRGILACFPMHGEKRYRLVLISRTPQSKVKSDHLELCDFQKLVNQIATDPIELSNPEWLSQFYVHHRMVESYNKGRIFLAGDAAHVHSPIGGQGMNTGIQDAVNLSQKLSDVLNGSPEQLLQDYEIQRKPIAKSVLRNTDFAMKAGLIRENFLVRAVRSNIAPMIIGSAAVQRQVLNTLSQIEVARTEITRIK